jgi:hypothetical protein
MTPMSTPNEMHTGPEVVIPIVLAAVVIVVIAYLVHRFLVGAADELAELGRTYGPIASKAALDKRPGLPQTPWFCSRCTSRNGLAAKTCYKCGAERAVSELTVEGAEEPAGASAGLAQRTRSRG